MESGIDPGQDYYTQDYYNYDHGFVFLFPTYHFMYILTYKSNFQTFKSTNELKT